MPYTRSLAVGRSWVKQSQHFANSINPVTTNVPHHIETSQSICNADQLTDPYMVENTGRKKVKITPTKPLLSKATVI